LTRLDAAGRRLVLAWGCVLALMNAVFYLAIARLQLGTVAAIEFLPVVALAALGARCVRNIAALIAAVSGVWMVTEVRLADEPAGYAFAFADAALFALYIVLAHRAARHLLNGLDGLAAAMLIACVCVAPVSAPQAATAFDDPAALAAGIGVGVSSSVIPYVCDQLAMARMARSTYALLVALLPAIAAVIGLAVLRQIPTPPEFAGVALVVAGVALHRETRDPPDTDSPATDSQARISRTGVTTIPTSIWLLRPPQERKADMEYTTMGRTGLQVSRICLGMMSYGDQSGRDWILGEDAAELLVRRAVEAGVTYFDTADMYSNGASEQVTGRLLEKFFPHREDYVLGTKVYFPMGPGPNDRGLSRKHILAGIDASLSRLGTDYVDLYQIHRWDDETPIEETMQALHDVVRAGKARYIGASSMYAWQFAKAQHTARANGWTTFVSMQNHYNLVYREEEREMIPLCRDQGVGIIPWSPLARGLLTGTRERGGVGSTLRAGSDPVADDMYVDADFDVVDAVRELAAERGLAPAQIALAWLLGKPGVTAPIVGATKAQHVDDAVAAIGVGLGDEEVARLETLYRPHRILGHH
jgi:aryl-alcohol dehydrogenase-like predicted oxidoreductase/threonine/homoserine efflux transporter RhtA